MVYLKFAERVALKCSITHKKIVTMLGNGLLLYLIEVIISQRIYIYEIITLYTSNIYNFICQLHLNEDRNN